MLQCRSLVSTPGESLPVSGLARVIVDGAVTKLELGDVIEVIGKLALPGEPSNPGDFDQRAS